MTFIRSASDPTPPRTLVFATLALAVLASAASTRIMDALVPGVAKDFGRSVGAISFAVSAYALSYSCCQFIYGPLGDRIGPYRIVFWTTALSACAALACASAPSLTWLAICRLVAGGIAAAIGPLTMVWISHVTSHDERPLIFARMTTASICGATVGQIGSGLLAQLFDWRMSFVLTAILFACAALILAWIGFRRPGVYRIGRVAMAPGHGAVFGVLRRPAVRATLIWVGMEGLSMYTSLTYVAVMLQQKIAVGSAGAGLIIAFFGGGGIAFALVARHVMRWCPSPLRALSGGVLAALCLALLVLVKSAVLAALCMFGIGLGFFTLHNVLQISATHMAPDAPAAGVSLFAATFFFSQAIGAMLGGWAFDHLGPRPACFLSAAILIAVATSVARAQRANSRTM